MPNENNVFTSGDDVYAVRDTALPQIVIQEIAGRASRSSLSFREVFESMCKKCGIESFGLDGVREMQLDAITLESVDFAEKWSSHESLKETAHYTVFFDKLSIQATKVIEVERCASYQEKSTRYRDFDATKSFYPDVCKVHGDPVRRVYAGRLYDTCKEVYESLLPYGKDIARYALPVGASTAMACTASIRSWERIIIRLVCFDTAETVALAGEIFRCLSEVCSYFSGTLSSWLKGCTPASFASVIGSYNGLLYDHTIDVSATTHDAIVEVCDNHIHIEGIIDIGAHRDLQRHRSAIQSPADYRPLFGHITSSDEIFESVDPELKKGYDRLCELSLSTYERVRPEGQASTYGRHADCQYFSILGMLTKFEMDVDTDSWGYIYNLRTGKGDQRSTTPKTVHKSYSRWCELVQSEINGMDRGGV